MSLRPYPAYKPSGLEWLGDVPEHWNVLRANRLATVNDEVLPENTDPDYEIEYVDIGSVSLESGIECTEQLAFRNAPSRARRVVRDGDVIVSTVRTYLKAIALVSNPPSNMVASTGFAVFRPKADQISGFVNYALKNEGFVQQVIARSTGVSYPAINASELARIELPAPPSDEQAKIASFLDCETAKIDALITEQEKLLALLAEKRQATISNAVTRGLNPNVTMKDSGVEWLGEVPAHWKVCPVRRVVAEHRQGYYSEAPYVDQGIRLVRITDLRPNAEISYEECPQVADEAAVRPFLIQPKDFLFARTGGAGAFGVVEEKEQAVAYAAYLIRFRFTSEVDSEFIRWFFLSDVAQRSIAQQIHGGVNKNVHAEDIKSVPLVYPPLREQIAIAEFVRSEVIRLGDLCNQAGIAIDLLRERRQSLIAAAVTGKIDVCEIEGQAAV